MEFLDSYTNKHIEEHKLFGDQIGLCFLVKKRFVVEKQQNQREKASRFCVEGPIRATNTHTHTQRLERFVETHLLCWRSFTFTWST